MSDLANTSLKLEEVAQALVGHAARILPGDEAPDMAQIRATVLALALDLGGGVALKRVMAKVNDPDTIQLVKSMIGSIALELELEAKGGHAATWVPPIHTAAIGGVATSAIGLAAGTLALPAGLILIGGFGTAWIATTFWRAKQARKEALLKRNADLVKALAAAI